jgi:hypothetical protein
MSSERQEIVRIMPAEEIMNRRNDAITEVFNRIDMKDITREVYRDAMEYSRETGRASKVIGARVVITETKKGGLRKMRSLTVEFEGPTVALF